METGEKESNTKHLIQCLNTFIENHKIIKNKITKEQIDPKIQENDEELEPLLNVPSEDLVTQPTIKECLKCTQWYKSDQFSNLRFNILGRVNLNLHDKVNKSFYQILFSFDSNIHTWLNILHEIEDMSRGDVISKNEVEFTTNSGLSDAVVWIRKYEYYKEYNYYWAHISIRACAFNNFLYEFTKIKTEFCIIPYWCLCDGETTKHDDILYTAHRHMIIVCKSEDVFHKAWKNVRSDSQFQGKRYDRFRVQTKIRNVLHLLHTINYVGGTKS
jgi:hypothetical protein